MKIEWKVFLFLLTVSLGAGCVEPYEPPVLSESHRYLVVEGFLNSGGEASSIHLSRTARLADTAYIEVEQGATVSIENKEGEAFYLNEASEGEYLLDPVSLNPQDQYRLRIKTRDGKEYLSDPVSVKHTPPIDSVSWIYEDDGVHIFVNTHDPQNNSWYYRWEFEESWEFNVPYQSFLKAENGQLIQRPAPTPTQCWRNGASTSLILGSSARLEQDVIFQQALTTIPRASRKLASRYSILVKQFTLSQEAFEYYRQMRQNSEQMGSFFDPQPVELKGNIQSLHHPEEPVLGFFSIGSVQQERIFIDRQEVENWGFKMICELLVVPPDNLAGLVPLYSGMEGIYATSQECVDCSIGGNPVKPDFWE